VSLEQDQIDELERLFAPGTAARKLGMTGAGPDELQAAAKDAMARWRTFMVTNADPAQAKTARIVLRSYQQLWTGLKERRA
jgi:hypothetical protein